MDLEELINSLKKEKYLVIVEGINDKKALLSLEISSIAIKGPIFSFCERTAVSNRKVILLMDTDREGAKLIGVFISNFSKLGVVVDKSYWLAMKKLRVSHVEGIPKALINLERHKDSDNSFKAGA